MADEAQEDRAKTLFVWNADILVHRGPVDDPLMLWAENSGHVLGDFEESALEASAVEWLAGAVPADPNDIEVVSFTWSSLEAPPVSFPPPPQ